MKAHLTRFCAFIEARTGIVLSPSLLDQAADLLDARAGNAGFATADDYLTFLEGDAGRHEFQSLLNLLTVGKTAFWRYPEHVEAIVERIVPTIDERLHKALPCNIWSTACSTGEEPYTLAMSLAAADWFGRRNFRLVATDINTASLEQARQGRYRMAPREWSTLPSAGKRFLLHEGAGATVDETLKKRWRFEALNLVRDAYPFSGSWQLIICANVLIYFTPATVEAVLKRLYDALAADGILFLGGAESLPPSLPEFTVLRFGDSFAYMKGDFGGDFADFELDPPKAPVQPPAPAISYAALPCDPAQLEDAVVDSFSPHRAVQASASLRATIREIVETAAQGEREQAIARLTSLRDEHPNCIDIAQLLPVLLFAARRFDVALAAIDDALTLDPLAFDLYFYRGWIHRARGEFDDAQEAYRRALFLEPGFAFARYEFALTLHAENAFADAAQEYRRAAHAAADPLQNARLAKRAAGKHDSYWQNGALIIDLCRENQRRAERHEAPMPADGVGR